MKNIKKYYDNNSEELFSEFRNVLKKGSKKALILLCIFQIILFSGCSSDKLGDIQSNTSGSINVQSEANSNSTGKASETDKNKTASETSEKKITAKSGIKSADLSKIPAYSGKPYVVINSNKPEFKKSEYTTKSFEKYKELDGLGRCGTAYACVGTDIMPDEERGPIGQVRPSGWHTIKYDCVDGRYLYNRCHLIGYQLTGENANEENLITGTRYMNVDGMLPFENMVSEYVTNTNNHVLYRVTPIFKGKNLVAKGVQMEGYSVEDHGKGVDFNVFVYNVQPGVSINYSNGDSSLAKSSTVNDKNSANKNYSDNNSNPAKEDYYIVNDNTKKFHRPNCRWVKDMSDSNKMKYKGDRKKLIENGYSPCKTCNP